VATVTVAPNPATIIVGQTGTLAPTVTDVNGTVVTDRVVTWSSSNTAVATVSSTGVVTGVSIGSATITATSEGKSGSSGVTIAPVPVGSVAVSPATASIVQGHTQQLAVTVKDLNGTVVTDRVVAWSSSNAAAATVSSTGLVTGVAAGATTITATSEGKSGTASVNVTAVPVGSVSVSPNPASVISQQTTALTPTVKDQNGTVVTDRVVTWSSSNTSVATVSSTGVVTGGTPGTATITATSEGKFGSATVNVLVPPVGSVAVSPPTASIPTAGSTTFTAIVKDVNGNVVTNRVVTWSSSNVLVATVSPASGAVFGLIPGTATITATSEGVSGSGTVTVALVPVGSVTVAPSTASVVSGSTSTFTATVKDANGTVVTGRSITWTSSNPAVATVTASGVATGLAVGTTTITATSEAKSGTATLTVTAGPIASVQVSPPSASVKVNETVQLTATAVDAHGNAISGASFTWQTSDGPIASVSSTGLVTAKKAGSATITATAGGQSDTSSITVTR
jgi:trimeric autotransporter adhesin